MKFPVCASPAGAVGLLRACGRLRGAERSPVPAAMESAAPRLGLLLAAFCLLASHGKLQLVAFLASPPRETLLAGASRSPGQGCASAQEI